MSHTLTQTYRLDPEGPAPYQVHSVITDDSTGQQIVSSYGPSDWSASVGAHAFAYSFARKAGYRLTPAHSHYGSSTGVNTFSLVPAVPYVVTSATVEVPGSTDLFTTYDANWADGSGNGRTSTFRHPRPLPAAHLATWVALLPGPVAFVNGVPA